MEFFSAYGRRMYNPQGIRYWTNRARQSARIDATIGSAKGEEHVVFPEGSKRQITLCVPFIKSFFPNLDTEEIFPYTPEAGTIGFRTAWKKWILRRAGTETERLTRQMHLPVLTPGITAAIGLCARMLLDPGESIVLANKRWENYDHILKTNLNLNLQEFPLFADGNFNLGGLEQSIKNLWETQDNAVVLLNFPNNPTGYCPSTETAAQIVKSLTGLAHDTTKKLTILFDDAYESYVYDPAAGQSSLFYQVHPEANLLPIKLDGVTKEMLWYGGRGGTITVAMPDAWLDSPGEVIRAELDNKFSGMIRSSFSASCTVTQSVATKALEQMDRLVEERDRTITALAKRHEILREELARLPGDLTKVDPFHGGFFCFVNLAPGAGLRATEVADRLLEKHGVGTVPFEQGEVNGVRIAYCSVSEEDIPDLCRSLAETIRELAREAIGNRQ
jgi:aspartate/methionine/tyrosine aminotransferase